VKQDEEEEADARENGQVGANLVNYSIQNTPKRPEPNVEIDITYHRKHLPEPARFIKATTKEEAAVKSKELLGLDTEEMTENTNLWAKATARRPPVRQTIEVGDIETSSMNIEEKSNLLHNVAMSAATDLGE